TITPPPHSTLFPYTTLFRSRTSSGFHASRTAHQGLCSTNRKYRSVTKTATIATAAKRTRSAVARYGRSAWSRYQRHGDGSPGGRSEEHTSELQSRENLVCRL